MRNQHGMTVAELLVVLVIAGLVVAVAVVVSTPWMAEESMRSAAMDVQSMMQLARIEAVSRNRDCRFVIDSLTGELEVHDTLGSVVLHERQLPSAITMGRPDFGAAVTLDLVSGSIYQTVFSSDGTVTSGSGSVYVQGGDSYAGVAVLGAGGIEIRRWDGGGWEVAF